MIGVENFGGISGEATPASHSSLCKSLLHRQELTLRGQALIPTPEPPHFDKSSLADTTKGAANQ